MKKRERELEREEMRKRYGIRKEGEKRTIVIKKKKILMSWRLPRS